MRIKIDKEGQITVRDVAQIFGQNRDGNSYQGTGFVLNPGGEIGKLAERAIALLLHLTHVQTILDVVRANRRVLEKASYQISVLYAYKKVHDLLHEVEFGSYKSMEMDARDFPHQESAREKMRIHLFQLRKYVSDAEDIVNGTMPPIGLIGGVRNQLKAAFNKLDEAVRHQDGTACRSALDLLSPLSQAQSNFNALFNQAAEQLEMDSLVAAMRSVQQVVSSSSLPSAQIDVFRLGVDDLEALARDLHAQTKQHDDWQQLDNMLRVIDSNSPELLSKIEAFWLMITSQIAVVGKPAPVAGAPVSVATASSWRALISQDTVDLVKALATRDLIGARCHFLSLYQHVAEHFDRVDKQLLQVCDKITRLRDPLQNLVGIL